MRTAILIAIAFALSGCATASNCAGWEPINPSRKDVLSEGTVKQVLSHNEFGLRQGCWQRPVK